MFELHIFALTRKYSMCDRDNTCSTFIAKFMDLFGRNPRTIKTYRRKRPPLEYPPTYMYSPALAVECRPPQMTTINGESESKIDSLENFALASGLWNIAKLFFWLLLRTEVLLFSGKRTYSRRVFQAGSFLSFCFYGSWVPPKQFHKFGYVCTTSIIPFAHTVSRYNVHVFR